MNQTDTVSASFSHRQGKAKPLWDTMQACQVAARHFNGHIPLVCCSQIPLVSLMFVKYGERGAICKAVSPLGLTKSVIGMTLRVTCDCDLDKYEA